MSSSNAGDANLGDYGQQSNQASITAFLAKLWALVNDSTCDDLIAWDSSGGSFHVFDQARFAREILPRYFKHNNFASFIRQLNMYGFRKMSTVEHGSLKNERDDIEFAHPYFIKGHESLLELIKRRAPDSQQKSTTQTGSQSSSALVSSNHVDSTSNCPVELNRLLDDVRNLQTKQTSLSDKLAYMQTENEALWSEIGSLRQKHSKQQQIVSKLIEFLLHFLPHNSVQANAKSVVKVVPKQVIPTNLVHSDQTINLRHSNKSPLLVTEQGLSSNALKRKQATLMITDDPNKRITIQQHKHNNNKFLNPSKPDKQQSITINELTDTDVGGWLQTTNTLPLVDLVPSPPPSTQTSDDNYLHQRQSNDYEWSTASINEHFTPHLHDANIYIQQNATTSTVGVDDTSTNTYIPDFILCTNDINEKEKAIEHTHRTKLTDMKAPFGNSIKKISMPSLLKEERIEFPNAFQTGSLDALKSSPTLNSTLYTENSQELKLDIPSEQISFSLDDITGDVDHIQSSLDNIRELMFETLPDGASIEDLFGEENGLLSPLLQSATNDNLSEALLIANNIPNQTETAVNSKPTSNVHNQLLEKLITETAKVEEQRNTIEQLEREKSTLTDKLHMLEKQAHKRKR